MTSISGPKGHEMSGSGGEELWVERYDGGLDGFDEDHDVATLAYSA
jgi:hypothetical protein